MIWYNCTDCDNEFRVIVDSEAEVLFCPFCAATIETPTDEIEEDFYGDPDE